MHLHRWHLQQTRKKVWLLLTFQVAISSGSCCFRALGHLQWGTKSSAKLVTGSNGPANPIWEGIYSGKLDFRQESYSVCRFAPQSPQREICIATRQQMRSKSMSVGSKDVSVKRRFQQPAQSHQTSTPYHNECKLRRPKFAHRWKTSNAEPSVLSKWTSGPSSQTNSPTFLRIEWLPEMFGDSVDVLWCNLNKVARCCIPHLELYRPEGLLHKHEIAVLGFCLYARPTWRRREASRGCHLLSYLQKACKSVQCVPMRMHWDVQWCAIEAPQASSRTSRTVSQGSIWLANLLLHVAS